MSDHLSCTSVLDLVEAIAAGDAEVSAAMREHLETCPRCAAALATARRIESALAGRDAPPAPARFTSTVLGRIRRERWRSEQRVDRLFNVAIAVGVLLIAGGAAALLNLDGVTSIAGAGWQYMTSASANTVKAAAPMLTAYIASTGLLVSALGMWWWAERRLTL